MGEGVKGWFRADGEVGWGEGGGALEANPASCHYRCAAEMQGHPDTCHGQPAESPRMKLTRCA